MQSDRKIREILVNLVSSAFVDDISNVQLSRFVQLRQQYEKSAALLVDSFIADYEKKASMLVEIVISNEVDYKRDFI